MEVISLDAAIAVTGVSKRTLWRRVSDGTVNKVSEDSRGRAMLCLGDVADLMNIVLDDDDYAMLVKADNGNANAQADVGAMFHVAGVFDAAIYWLKQAATQNNAEAMQWLGGCYAAGQGVPQNDNLALMWLAKSASLGHPIAQQQLSILMPALGKA